MKKRVLPLLTALCLLMGALAAPAGAEVAQPPEEAPEAIEAVETDKVDAEEAEAAEEGEDAQEAETAEEGEPVIAPQPEPEPEPETKPNPLQLYVIEQRVYIDDDPIPYGFYMCALVDEKGNATNYIRARDLAMALRETPAQFGVTWNGQVNFTRGGESDPSGTGQSSGVYSYAANYEVIREATVVNGRTVTLEGVRFTDSGGGGHTYYKLRDLGEALDFNVGWSAARGVYIETDKPYDPNN